MEHTAKEIFKRAIDAQPENSSADEILQELLLQKVILEGLKDISEGKTITHEEFGKIMQSWGK